MAMSAPQRRGRKRRAMSDINVVPYIDVMLVLLIIFMATAPLMNLGVDIQLPKSDAKTIEHGTDPVLVSLTQAGKVYLTLGKAPREEISLDTLEAKIGAFVRNNKSGAVLIGADDRVDYGRVYDVMVRLQKSGAPKVGLMSRPFPTEGSR